MTTTFKLKSLGIAAFVVLAVTTSGDQALAQAPRKGFGPRLVTNQALFVSRIFPGFTAQRQGLERGDVLFRIDGQRVRGPEDVRRLIRGKRQVRVTVLNRRNFFHPTRLFLYPRFGKIGIDGFAIDVDRLKKPVPPLLRPLPFPKPRQGR